MAEILLLISKFNNKTLQGCYQSNEISIHKIHLCTEEMSQKLHLKQLRYDLNAFTIA